MIFGSRRQRDRNLIVCLKVLQMSQVLVSLQNYAIKTKRSSKFPTFHSNVELICKDLMTSNFKQNTAGIRRALGENFGVRGTRVSSTSPFFCTPLTSNMFPVLLGMPEHSFHRGDYGWRELCLPAVGKFACQILPICQAPN